MGRCSPGPELTASVRLPVVVFSAERHAVKIGTLLLSEITRSCWTGLWIEDEKKINLAIPDFFFFNLRK